jgi:diguanylate cyclase (GGDEF)-like protein
MNLDARTLLFALILTNSMMVLSLFAASGRKVDGKQDGTAKWATAILLETVAWMLVAARGHVPDLVSVVVASGLLSATFALMLAAVCEFQQSHPPRWQYFLPGALVLVMATVLIDDIHGRFFWGSLIYIFQIMLIASALVTDAATRAGRAWRLLFGGAWVLILVLGMRAFVGLSGQSILAQPLSRVDGVPNWVQVVSFVALLATSLLGSIGFLLMVKERADGAVMHLAMTDSLTGVPNRRAVMDYAERALALRGDRQLALLMVDVDHFKRINDAHGHPVGDEVLCQVAVLLAGRLRGGDLLGRYGGEEFCVVALDTDAAGARKLAETLRKIVAEATLKTERGDISVTVSIGVALCTSNTSRQLKDILAEADSALYTAKQGGRNQVFCFC